VNLMVGVLGPLGQTITTLPLGPEHAGRTAGPSFELFYESDYLMPHLAAAWTMLEERLRQASDFAAEIRQRAAAPLSEQLGPIAAALDGIADTLAARFAEWGATSRFLTAAAGEAARAQAGVEPRQLEPIGFAEHVKPMFREGDRQAMRFAFDLWSYADVRAHAAEIAARLADGSMPCDGAWPQRQIDAFTAWIEAGMPESVAP
jgi:hypothetical protein